MSNFPIFFFVVKVNFSYFTQIKIGLEKYNAHFLKIIPDHMEKFWDSLENIGVGIINVRNLGSVLRKLWKNFEKTMKKNCDILRKCF